jgi:hypothetical protein
MGGWQTPQREVGPCPHGSANRNTVGAPGYLRVQNGDGPPVFARLIDVGKVKATPPGEAVDAYCMAVGKPKMEIMINHD